jgi:hypothetical protein
MLGVERQKSGGAIVPSSVLSLPLFHICFSGYPSQTIAFFSQFIPA